MRDSNSNNNVVVNKTSNNTTDDPHRYDDIINLPRPISKHPHIPNSTRAAQFAPFAALEGYDELINNAEDNSICLYNE